MDIIADIEKIIGLCKGFYDFYNQYNELDSHYGEIYNDVFILEALLIRVKNSNIIPNDIKPCIRSIGNTLEEILRKVHKYQQEGFFKRAFRIKTKKAYKMLDTLQVQTKRIKLILELKSDILNSSRFNINNVLTNKEALKFWEEHFGSENLSISFPIFIQTLEQEHTKLRHGEILVFKQILDSDNDGMVTAYEFNSWLEHFGMTINRALIMTLTSLLNTKTGKIRKWYVGEMFKEQAHDKLINSGFGSILLRISDINKIFIIECVGIDKKVCQFQLEFCGIEMVNGVTDKYKLLNKRDKNITETMLYPLICKKSDCHDMNHHYFDNLYNFMKVLKMNCKELSLTLNVPYLPHDMKTNKIKEKYRPENNRWYSKFYEHVNDIIIEKRVEKINKMAPLLYHEWYNQYEDERFQGSTFRETTPISTRHARNENNRRHSITDDNLSIFNMCSGHR